MASGSRRMGQAQGDAPMKKRPNIVLVMTDQHRGDCLSVNGHPHLMTPVLDYLAADGVRFTRAYSECPTCVPARRCVMTGQTPFTNGVVGFALGEPIHTTLTLPEVFRRAGYQTASVGRSMHQSPTYARYGFEIVNDDPFAEVYSEFNHVWRLSGRGKNFQSWPHVAAAGITGNGFRARPWNHEERFHETNWSTAKAVEFLDRRDRDVPFFLYVGFVAPHPPLLPPQAYYDRYIRMQLDEPVVGDWADLNAPEAGGGAWPDGDRIKLSGRFNQECRAGYYGLINHVDDQLSLLFERLRNEKEDTYIIFTSDHGEMLGDHHCFRKYVPYEGSVHIPMIINGPGLPRGMVAREAVCLMDILPTFCDLAGIDVPEGVEGMSMLKCFGHERQSRQYIHGEHSWENEQGGHHFLTDGRRKYIWFTRSGREQFFDLEQDPHELHDAIADERYRDEVDGWRKHLIRLLQNRPEGFSDGNGLQPGKRYPMVVRRNER
ncbi:MAG: sulfatase-like hydrolase/transferase [Spirochaetota bacterium]